VASRGLGSATAEFRLQTLEETLSLYKVEVKYEYVVSEENPADELTKFPPFINKDPTNRPEVASLGVMATITKSWRDHFTVVEGHLQFEDEQKLIEFIREYHSQRHLGIKSTYQRLMSWVKSPKLRKHVSEVVSGWNICRLAKSMPNQNADGVLPSGRKFVRSREEKLDTSLSTITFNKIHVDVVGHFHEIDGKHLFYCITCVDNASSYAFGLPTRNPPKDVDIIELLTDVMGLMNKCPLVLLTDGGANMVSNKMREFVWTHQIKHSVTAKHSSCTNGKVERLHNVINEFIICSKRGKSLIWSDFKDLVKRALSTYNSTPKGDGISPHEKVFKFKPYVDPEFPIELRPEFEQLCSVNAEESWGPGWAAGSPIGVRNFKHKGKANAEFLPAEVQERVGQYKYKLKNLPGTFHVKDLKPLAGTVSDGRDSTKSQAKRRRTEEENEEKKEKKRKKEKKEGECVLPCKGE
jgi:transposase InsO family protein